MHALLTHLAAKNFPGAPRPFGFDDQGREVPTFIEGETVGSRKPWPAWTHAEDTLGQVARWMRAYHPAVADFVPPPGARFFDWDFAGPATPEWDLAFAAFSWVPLHARHETQGQHHWNAQLAFSAE